MSISTGKTGIKMSEAISNPDSLNSFARTEKKEPTKRTSRKSSTTGYGLLTKRKKYFKKQKSSTSRKPNKSRRNKK